MESDLMDYCANPFADHIIFENPNFAASVSEPSTTTEPFSQDISPVVSLPGLNFAHFAPEPPPEVSPGLEAPPLSPGRAHLLSTYSPHFLSFDQH